MATVPSARAVPVLVVDEQPIAALGVVTCLAANGFRPLTPVTTTRQMVATVELERPTLVVIDPAARDRAASMAVLAAIDDIVTRFGTPVLGFTSDSTVSAVHAALEHGCLGIVPRDAPPEALIAAARAVANGERHVHQRVLAVLLAHRRESVSGDDSLPSITGRELEVLTLVADGKSNHVIAAELSISLSTVKTHVESLLHKLGARDRAHAVSTAMRLGLLH